MQIRTGTPRPPKPAAATSAIGLAWIAGLLGVKSEAEKEEALANRAERLAAFVRGDPAPNVWPSDLRPQFVALFDQTLGEMLALFDQPPSVGATERLWVLGGQLRGYQKWAEMIDGTIAIGQGAMARLIERRTQAGVTR